MPKPSNFLLTEGHREREKLEAFAKGQAEIIERAATEKPVDTTPAAPQAPQAPQAPAQ
jgi:hypothetical protein